MTMIYMDLQQKSRSFQHVLTVKSGPRNHPSLGFTQAHEVDAAVETAETQAAEPWEAWKTWHHALDECFHLGFTGVEMVLLVI